MTDAPANGVEPRDDDGDAAFPIVGLGASAGGLEALEKLIGRLRDDGMAYVVIQHLAPGHESLLADILARGSALKVATVTDGVEVEPNVVYVTPPSVEIALRDGALRLSAPSAELPRHSIDAFFRSLAADSGTRAIGVVLSGAGADGTLGLRAIREAGGIAFVQEPGTAAHPNMPQSAIDAGCADFQLSPEAIGDELMRLSAHPFVARRRPVNVFSDPNLGRIFELLRRGFGVDFAGYKRSTIERRIERRMALQKLSAPADYVRFVEGSADELAALYGDLLIGVTAFFRDQEPFETLKALVFPRLLEKRDPDSPLRIWVPGCATGEEAYSVAMCLVESLGDRAGAFKVQVFATDIDEQALARARQARYPSSIELDVSPARLQRFFSRVDSGYQVSRQIRDLVVFARQNLGKDPPFSRLDLISCRNVLIYMQPALQRRVLRVFHYALNPDGFLLLGTSESVGDASDHFSLLDRKLKLYQKKGVGSPAVADFAFGSRLEGGARGPPLLPPPQLERRPLISVQQLADRKVLEKYGPPGVLVDAHLDIVQFRGDTGPYLAPSPGTATLNVLKLVRPELMLPLRAALHQVMSEGLPLVSEATRMWGPLQGASVECDVTPLNEPNEPRRCFLVLFRKTAPDAPDAPPAPSPPAPAEPRVQELERELLVTKEYLQTTVQELEVANEELQSSNEELQSSNEELQSTNEELETSKEELQSTNEELATVNDELQSRMSQLGLSSDDVKNLVSGLSAAFVIVDMDLRIRRFSAAAEQLLNLVPADVGRPIGYLGAALNAPHFEALVSESINTARERGQRVRCSDGHWYAVRALPYRTSEHAIRGAVLEFLRAPMPRRPGEPAEIHEFVGKVLSTLPQVLMLLDEQLRLTWVNRAFFETFSVGAEVLGRPLDEVWPGRAANPQLWEALERTVSGGIPFSNIDVGRPFGSATVGALRFSAQCIASEGDRPALTLVMMAPAALEEAP